MPGSVPLFITQTQADKLARHTEISPSKPVLIKISKTALRRNRTKWKQTGSGLFDDIGASLKEIGTDLKPFVKPIAVPAVGAAVGAAATPFTGPIGTAVAGAAGSIAAEMLLTQLGFGVRIPKSKVMRGEGLSESATALFELSKTAFAKLAKFITGFTMKHQKEIFILAEMILKTKKSQISEDEALDKATLMALFGELVDTMKGQSGSGLEDLGELESEASEKAKVFVDSVMEGIKTKAPSKAQLKKMLQVVVPVVVAGLLAKSGMAKHNTRARQSAQAQQRQRLMSARTMGQSISTPFESHAFL